MTMRTVRFKVHRGLLEPLEPVPLVEGTELNVALPVPEPKASTIGALLEILEHQPRIDPSLIDELNRSIESGKLPVSSAGVFDDDRR
jgi:predicted DNA-binding antitoxin AbrB/MazE fold protein